MKKLIFTLFLVSLIVSGTVYAANVVKVEREFGPSFVGYAPDKCIVIVREGSLPIRATSQAGIAITGNHGLDEVARRFQVCTRAYIFRYIRSNNQASLKNLSF